MTEHTIHDVILRTAAFWRVEFTLVVLVLVLWIHRSRLQRSWCVFLGLAATLLFGACIAGQSKVQPSIEEGTVKELTDADTIIFNDHIGSVLSETNGAGVVSARFAAHAFGVTRSDTSDETRQYANAPRDASIGLDLMGARFYAPDLGVWTIGDPVLVNAPGNVATAQFGTANPYAYANLRPTIATDDDGNFWHIVAGGAIGALVGGGIEAVRQYATNGKIDDWGRIGAAAAGGAVAGAMTAACPAAGVGSVMAVGGASAAAAGVTERLVESGGKSAGTTTDVVLDTGIGAATGGLVKGGSAVVKKVVVKAVPKAAAVASKVRSWVKKPSEKGAFGPGTLTEQETAQLQQLADKYNTQIDVVGSRAAGKGRNIHTDLPAGKGPGTRSDIDFRYDGQVEIDTGSRFTDQLREVGNGTGSPSFCTGPGGSRPPVIEFKPNTPAIRRTE